MSCYSHGKADQSVINVIVIVASEASMAAYPQNQNGVRPRGRIGPHFLCCRYKSEGELIFLMLTPPYIMSSNIMASPKSNTVQVAQFICTTVYYLLYGITVDQNHPAVLGFQNYIQSILICSSNNVTASVILNSLLYVSRFNTQLKYRGIKTIYTEAQIWTISLILADVTMNDAAYAIKSWSQVTNIPTKHLIAMRKDFLEIINYDLYVNQLQYASWITSLQQISAHVSTILYYQKPVQQPITYQQMTYQTLMRPRQVYCISPPLASPQGCSNQVLPSPPNYYNQRYPVQMQLPQNIIPSHSTWS